MKSSKAVFQQDVSDVEKSKSYRATFSRKRNGQYVIVAGRKFENSLLMSVALLELGNSCDFPANVWNRIPIPIYAIVLMAVGGTVAISMIFFAIWDAKFSWRNIQLLREERQYLREQCTSSDGGVIDALLEVNGWELGTEVIDRLSVDLLMGMSCGLVGIGTLLAIGGANPLVFHASNLLSGYIGNSPAAVCGVLIALWCVYMSLRAFQRGVVQADAISKPLLKRRMRLVQTESAVVATTGIVAGFGSMLTATRWYGYVILAPCILSFMCCKYAWRKSIGYSRKSIMEFDLFDQSDLVAELKYVSQMQRLVTGLHTVQQLIPEWSPMVALDLILRSNLFDEFCSRLIQRTGMDSVVGPLNEETQDVIAIQLSDVNDLACGNLSTTILETAEECMEKDGPAHFRDRQCHILEVLGSYHVSAATQSKY
ncbi:hypothetical protein V1525DRAFT_415009 [Lipomyces kononenkoae]|uniref:Uncharacterized protein n=1 Tax=Lipomyces kononenkoae TaxID=34357 RepID=A0ACC3SQC6_LIPKO